MNESQRIQYYLDQAYTVEMVNPDSTKFNQKYKVYKQLWPGDSGKRFIMMNESGEPLGVQENN